MADVFIVKFSSGEFDWIGLGNGFVPSYLS